jgi:hypothetical protein
MRHPIYLAFGLLLVATVAFADWRGFTFSNASEVKNVPRSVRDNPGSYRPAYHFFGTRYSRGK